MDSFLIAHEIFTIFAHKISCERINLQFIPTDDNNTNNTFIRMDNNTLHVAVFYPCYSCLMITSKTLLRWMVFSLRKLLSHFLTKSAPVARPVQVNTVNLLSRLNQGSFRLLMKFIHEKKMYRKSCLFESRIYAQQFEQVDSIYDQLRQSKKFTVFITRFKALFIYIIKTKLSFYSWEYKVLVRRSQFTMDQQIINLCDNVRSMLGLQWQIGWLPT